MLSKYNTLITQNCDKENSTNAIYNGKSVKVITVFLDIDVALIEDENGEIFDVKNSLLR